MPMIGAPPATVKLGITSLSVSRLKVSEAIPVLPTVSVSLATIVCEPSANPAGV